MRLVPSWRARGESGSAAVEFAFVAPVFFMILFGIIEGGIMFFGQAALINAVQDAARLIRTGQAQGMAPGDFTQQVCNGIQPLLDCTNLRVDVESYPSGFASGGLGSPAFDASGNPPSGYSPGNACDVVVVRAFYKYSVITPIVSPLLTGGRGYNWLTAASAFRNEPFTAAVSGC